MQPPSIRRRSRPDPESVTGEGSATVPPAIDGYEVGYGKPPKHTRFPPGQSGNPKGKKRGTKNLSTIVEEVLSERLSVMLRGQEKKITQAEVIGRRLVKLAADGNPRMLAILLGLLAQETTPRGKSIPEPSDQPLTEAEQSVMDELIEIAREVSRESPGDGEAVK